MMASKQTIAVHTENLTYCQAYAFFWLRNVADLQYFKTIALGSVGTAWKVFKFFRQSAVKNHAMQIPSVVKVN